MLLADVVRVLAGGGDAGQRFIIMELRVPRGLDGLLVGAALGVSGALFQSVTRNPLGSPDIVGVGNGAATGALLLQGADVAAQWAVPSIEVPAGLARGLTGGAYLAWPLTRRRRF
ncbi:hypothetical protein C1I98_28305 [Spongiactinospora gelatinilytica]|uniref:Iron complex transport system permease protein n=2 Tax=Spongiactinospora gelatinilytica TaxID=2666298 RepID=A0A2W2FFC5_9ACTN|nr:hypothetical protein C1I98_28305 [Spongiactinospora gelatinilytica]